MDWAARSKDAFKNRPGYALFGIQQERVRGFAAESADALAAVGFDGYAVGGLVGESRAEMFKVLDFAVGQLPDEKPLPYGRWQARGSGRGVIRGIDMFDCVLRVGPVEPRRPSHTEDLLICATRGTPTRDHWTTDVLPGVYQIQPRLPSPSHQGG